MIPSEFKQHIRKAYRRLLHPLIRILMRNGFSAPETQELVRQVFVDIATHDESGNKAKNLSDSRIAIATGLTRREVNRLRTGQGLISIDTSLSRVQRLIAGWNQDPDFTGPYGLPLAIPFQDDSTQDAPDFVELVRRHGGGMPADAMLDELLRIGLAVQEGDSRLIRNTGRTYIPDRLDPAAMERFGKVIARLADTLEFNNRASTTGETRFERSASTDIGLTQEQYRQFDRFLREKCQELLETVDNWLAEHEGRIDAHKRPRGEVRDQVQSGIGVYHFLERRLPFEEEDTE